MRGRQISKQVVGRYAYKDRETGGEKSENTEKDRKMVLDRQRKSVRAKDGDILEERNRRERQTEGQDEQSFRKMYVYRETERQTHRRTDRASTKSVTFEKLRKVGRKCAEHYSVLYLCKQHFPNSVLIARTYYL